MVVLVIIFIMICPLCDLLALCRSGDRSFPVSGKKKKKKNTQHKAEQPEIDKSYFNTARLKQA